MRSLLVGNGLDIQFGGKEYLNASIIERAIGNIDTNNFNPEVYTKEIGQWFILLYLEFNSILKGNYDKYAFATYEKSSLKDLKRRYRNKKKINFTDIGIEDYMFIHDLFCRKNNIQNPNQYNFRVLLQRWILDAIYNDGKINEIYLNFPIKLKEFFNQYNNIFTTNYDRNIEIFSGKEVNYLHGAFHILDYVYDKNSFRNKLSDSPVEQAPPIEGYEYLFSTALMSFTGEIKKFSMAMAHSTNEVIDKFANVMGKNPEIEKDIESWKDIDNICVRNFYEAIMLKRKNKEMIFEEVYPVNKFESIKGKIDIVGLSPNNDIHIFELINNNEKINEVCFYYFEKSEILDIRKILNNKVVDVFPVKELWKEYS